MTSNLNGKKPGGGPFCCPEPWTPALPPSEQCHWTPSLGGLQASGLCLCSTGLGSAPSIHLMGSVESELQLVCTAKGWFPEPQVSWQDITGEELLTASEHHFQEEDGLFYVESMLVLRNTSAEIVSCFIRNPELSEKKGSNISIPGQCSASRTRCSDLTGKVAGTVPFHIIFFNQEKYLTFSNMH